MLEKLAQIEKNYEELTEQISSPEIMSDMKTYARVMKQHSGLGEIVEKISRRPENAGRPAGRARHCRNGR